MNELEIINPRSAAEIREQINLIQTVMKESMDGPTKENPEGVHYGVIPGTKKPTLLKAGAEKLSLLFRLRPLIESGKDIVQTDLGNGHREITVYCHIVNNNGTELATGIGSCSTMETKYRYRGGEKKPVVKDGGELVPVPKDYWNLKKEGKTQEAQELIGGRGHGVAKIDGAWLVCEIGEKQENPDIADVYNTVLKIAKKRAYIDGILSATAASDIFTQDMEDTAHAAPPVPANGAAAKPPVQMPGEKPATPPAAAADAPGDAQEPAAGDDILPENAISEPQRKRFFAIWKNAGKTEEQVKAKLQEVIGSTSTKHITKDVYQAVCEWAEKK